MAPEPRFREKFQNEKELSDFIIAKNIFKIPPRNIKIAGIDKSEMEEDATIMYWVIALAHNKQLPFPFTLQTSSNPPDYTLDTDSSSVGIEVTQLLEAGEGNVRKKRLDEIEKMEQQGKSAEEILKYSIQTEGVDSPPAEEIIPDMLVASIIEKHHKVTTKLEKLRLAGVSHSYTSHCLVVYNNVNFCTGLDYETVLLATHSELAERASEHNYFFDKIFLIRGSHEQFYICGLERLLDGEGGYIYRPIAFKEHWNSFFDLRT